MKRSILYSLLTVLVISSLIIPNTVFAAKSKDELLKGSYRTEKEGWIYIHIEGDPYQLGYQRGYLVAKETEKALEVMKFYLKNATEKNWDWYRSAAKNQWDRIMPKEYKEEFEGMADGLEAAGVKGIDYLDLWAWNGWIDLAWYYLPTVSKADIEDIEDEIELGMSPNLKRHPPGPGCSAFIATGDATRDGRIVMCHSLWYDYLFCNYWNVWMDMVPKEGFRIITQGFPGWIYGGTDFWINSGGLLVTETTISEFSGYDPKALPNFVRIRKALQYADNIDGFIEIMTKSVNGAYANDWLIGDIKTGEVARLELGLKNFHTWRTFNGYYVGSNMALSPEVQKETSFDYNNFNSTAISRRIREIEFMEKYYGMIDIDLAKKFQADHYDPSHEKYIRTANTICGHVELDPRGLPEWGYGPYYPGGFIFAEATDSELADKMKLWAKWGHGCDYDFIAEDFLKEHPEYNWQKPYLGDIISYPWTTFEIMK